MRFYLRYEGRLRPNGSVVEKQEIRRIFHPQLRDLWNTYPPLTGRYLDPTPPQGDVSVLRPVSNFTFAPLVCDKLKLLASLDILLLRPGTPGALVRYGGDIDNRLKTLFDALRAPQTPKEIPPNDSPGPDEDPLICLLDDDRRIAAVNVAAEQLLAPPNPDHVRLTIRVDVRAEYRTYGNEALV